MTQGSSSSVRMPGGSGRSGRASAGSAGSAAALYRPMAPSRIGSSHISPQTVAYQTATYTYAVTIIFLHFLFLQESSKNPQRILKESSKNPQRETATRSEECQRSSSGNCGRRDRGSPVVNIFQLSAKKNSTSNDDNFILEKKSKKKTAMKATRRKQQQQSHDSKQRPKRRNVSTFDRIQKKRSCRNLYLKKRIGLTSASFNQSTSKLTNNLKLN